MSEQIIPLSPVLKISNHGHILYIYEQIEKYIDNAVSYIKTGIELGHHLLMIENKDRYNRIYHELEKSLSHCALRRIHYVDNYEFYRLYGDFQYESIVQHFKNILLPFQENNIPIRTWAHVEWKEQKDIQSTLINYENKADEFVDSSQLISVCAYNGNEISAALHTHLLRNHDYFMTDYELVKSSLYSKRTDIVPALLEQKEHKLIKDQLKATKHQLQSFIMHNLDPVLILDMNEKVVTVNYAFERIFGWAANEILGLSAIELPHIPDDKIFEVNHNRSFTLLGEMIAPYESISTTKKGDRLDVMVSCFPLWEESNKLNGWAIIIRDITDKKQAQEILIRTEKLSIAGELAASIAHEIRNPVTTIKGFLQLLQSGAAEKKDYYYELMGSEIDRIELILSELLMLAKPQLNHFQLKDLTLLVGEVVSLMIPQANMNNVLIALEYDLQDVLIYCEENQLKQAFINFMKNAIDSMPNGGKLVIQMETIDNKELVIRFIDQGYGIPNHLLSKLGQPFYTTKEKGTGLGFMVSKKIIENHHGSIKVCSEENKGTTIELKIPLST
jgi:PAS domain S-box-containing protein